jgi:hypothetical protein
MKIVPSLDLILAEQIVGLAARGNLQFVLRVDNIELPG